LSDIAEAGSESVEEPVENGQSFEAGLISGVEGHPNREIAHETGSGRRRSLKNTVIKTRCGVKSRTFGRPQMARSVSI